MTIQPERLLAELTKHNPKTLGLAKEIRERIGEDQALFDAVFPGVFSEDPVLALRAGNVVEFAARKHPELVQPHKTEILKKLPEITETNIKWHVALLVGYLNLTKAEAARAAAVLEKWLAETEHKFVKVDCLQGLADIALKHRWLCHDVLLLLEENMIKGGAAINARGRKLKKLLEKAEKAPTPVSIR